MQNLRDSVIRSDRKVISLHLEIASGKEVSVLITNLVCVSPIYLWKFKKIEFKPKIQYWRYFYNNKSKKQKDFVIQFKFSFLIL